MPASPSLSLTEHFAALEYPRVERTKLHPLLSIVVIAICAVISGAESWDDIEDFGEIRAAWFATFLDLPHRVPSGCPSHDTFNRVFAALDPIQFRTCFLQWMEAVTGVLPTQVVALDGKTVRGSHDRGTGKEAIQMVSAWAGANRLVLTQARVDEKSNEIIALPALLHSLALAGCVVTIDAMGYQRQIAQQILDQEGTYVLALKDNQATLHDDVHLSVAAARDDGYAGIRYDRTETIEKGHGRIETRHALVIDDPAVLAWIQERHAWPGLAAIGLVQAERRLGSERRVEDRYYLLSHPLAARAFLDAVRGHWGIENSVHWVLEMAQSHYPHTSNVSSDPAA